jgi:ABC-type lipoprotein release transport system permease subunit
MSLNQRVTAELLAQDNAVFITKLLLVLSALIAGLIPARRAASIHPIRALRTD